MLSYVPNHFPILYDSVSKMGVNPVTVFAPAPRFWIAPDTTLKRLEALILRRFRGGKVALMSLGKVVGRSLRYRRKMRRECAPFLGFRRDPRRDRSNLAATPVSPPGGGEGSGERGRVCEDIGWKIGLEPAQAEVRVFCPIESN